MHTRKFAPARGDLWKIRLLNMDISRRGTKNGDMPDETIRKERGFVPCRVGWGLLLMGKVWGSKNKRGGERGKGRLTT